MTKSEMQQEIKDYILTNNHVSYAELEQVFEDHQFEYKGNLDSISGVCDHVVFWTGWNQDAYDIVAELLEHNLIHREPTPMIIYIMDGKTLQMPTVKTSRQYKKDHWLPIVFVKGAEK